MVNGTDGLAKHTACALMAVMAKVAADAGRSQENSSHKAQDGLMSPVAMGA